MEQYGFLIDENPLSGTLTGYMGRAQVDSSSLEMCAVILLPTGWKATGIRIYGTYSRVVDAYKVFNDNRTGYTRLFDSGTKYTGTEYTFDTEVTANIAAPSHSSTCLQATLAVRNHLLRSPAQ